MFLIVVLEKLLIDGLIGNASGIGKIEEVVVGLSKLSSSLSSRGCRGYTEQIELSDRRSIIIHESWLLGVRSLAKEE